MAYKFSQDQCITTSKYSKKTNCKTNTTIQPNAKIIMCQCTFTTTALDFLLDSDSQSYMMSNATSKLDSCNSHLQNLKTFPTEPRTDWLNGRAGCLEMESRLKKGWDHSKQKQNIWIKNQAPVIHIVKALTSDCLTFPRGKKARQAVEAPGKVQPRKV